MTKCGPGSTAANTVNLRKFLKFIVEKYEIDSVIDFGCGDLYWITLDSWPFSYLGIDDNVRPEALQRAAERGWSVSEGDLRSHKVSQKADLTICKDVLRHHDHEGISRIFGNLRSHYLLADYDDKTSIGGTYHRLVDDYCLQANKVDVRDWLGEPIESIVSNELDSKRFGLWDVVNYC